MTNTLADMRAPAADREVTAADNRPPLITVDDLAIEHGALVARVGELETAAAAQPHRVNDDEAQGRLQDVVKGIDDHSKVIESTREGTKAPFLAASRVVDGFFKALSEPQARRQAGATPGRLEVIRARLVAIGGDYLRRKEAEARRIREEAARAQRAEEDRLRREAEEARARAAALREQELSAERSQRTAEIRNEQADFAGQQAARLEQAAQAKPADLARTRSEQGSLGTLVENWNYRIVDPAGIPADKLWPYVKMADKEKFIRAFISANKPGSPAGVEAFKKSLPGVEFIPVTGMQVR